MRESCRQSKAEMVSKINNKIHQTWGPPFSRALYTTNYYSRLNCYSAADVCMGDWDQSYCIGGVGEESEGDRDEREGLE